MPSYIRLRLGFLFSAVIIGMFGMVHDDARLVYGGIGLGVIGLALRFLGRRDTPKP